MNAPSLSVVLPVYNAEEYLAEAIESILAQTYTDFEFLIIDDGSTDGSLDIINLHAREDQRIRVIARSNLGLVKTLNEGVARARGEYIARMDADDISRPERFKQQVDFLNSNPRCVVLGTSVVLIDDSGRELATWHCFLHDVSIRHALPAEGCIPHPTAMLRKSAVLEVGGYKEDYLAAEDYDLWHRLAQVGELNNLAEPLLYKRESSTAVSGKHATIQHRSADRIRSEIWDNEDLSAYKRLSLSTLCRLPGEHQPALVDLQRDLALIALRHRDARLLFYFCWDIVKFAVRARWHRWLSACA
jgi:hypothetical protein